MTIWTNVGYVTLFFLAGILAIPGDIHAPPAPTAPTRGSGSGDITLPMLRPTLFFVVGHRGRQRGAGVRHRVRAHRGGPQGRTDLVAHRIYAEAFGAAAIGRAAVMALVLFVLLVGVTIVQHLYFRRRITYDVV